MRAARGRSPANASHVPGNAMATSQSPLSPPLGFTTVLLGVLACLLVACGGRFRAKGKRLELDPSETERLERFLAELHATDLDRAPVEAALRGPWERVPAWDDLTQDRAQRERAWLQRSLERWEQDFAGRAPRAEQLLRDAAKAWIEQEIAAIDWRHHADLLSDESGAHRIPTRWLWQYAEPRTSSDWKNYIELLDDLPRYLGEVEAELQARRSLRTLPPRPVLLRARTRCLAWLAGRPFTSLSSAQSPWLAQAKAQLERSAGLTTRERSRIEGEIDRALRDSVGPAYQSLAATLDAIRTDAPDELAAAARTDGAAWYAYRLQSIAGEAIDPAEWHERSLRQVATLRNQIRAWQRRAQREGTLTRFLQDLRESEDTPRAADVLWSEPVAPWMRGAETALSGWLPEADMPPLEVRSVDDGWETGSNPYRYRAGVLRISPGPWVTAPHCLIQPWLASVSLPGNHLQTTLQSSSSELPELLRDRIRPAWVAGWGLYASGLAAEWSWYAGPEQELGQLLFELWHSACSVVDTGLHHQGWTESEAEEYLLKNSAFRRTVCSAAVRDCVERPGIRCAATLGLQQILDLRSAAELALGTEFDGDRFHQALLRWGALPPASAQVRLQIWIEEQR